MNEYAQGLCIELRLFEGMGTVLSTLEARGLPGQRRDTTAHAKPHPAPLLHALALCAVPVHAAIYVGDDERDIIAGRAAGMRTVGVRYGYSVNDEAVITWGADRWADTPIDVLDSIF